METTRSSKKVRRRIQIQNGPISSSRRLSLGTPTISDIPYISPEQVILSDVLNPQVSYDQLFLDLLKIKPSLLLIYEDYFTEKFDEIFIEILEQPNQIDRKILGKMDMVLKYLHQ